MTTVNMIASPFGAIPNRETCDFCGKPLKKTSITVMGKTFDNLPCYGSCGCEESAKRLTSHVRGGDRHKRSLYAQAGIGPEYIGAAMECSEYVKAVLKGRNVFITGENGVGKSILASSIAKRLLDKGEKVLFVNAAIESQRIKNGFDSDGAALWERMCEAGVLVIDDLGKGKPTEWDASMWYTIAEARNAARLPTVVTTNYDGGDLVERLTVNGDDSTARAIVSRFRGGACTAVVHSEDHRLKRV